MRGRGGSVQLTFTCDSYKYAIFYATCAEVDQYGNIQNYMCDTDPLVPHGGGRLQHLRRGDAA